MRDYVYGYTEELECELEQLKSELEYNKRNINYLIEAMKRFVNGLNNEDFGEIAEGIWMLDDFIMSMRDQISDEEFKDYTKLFDEFLDWEHWYYKNEYGR